MTVLALNLSTKFLYQHAALALQLDKTAGSNIQRTAREIGKTAYGYGWRWKT